ncbi:MAG TPA: cob(I)yrinic acid a,c-diamide adenosyltransferase [Candidatus Micrarchaeota archaeon]|nr:cob(I)yrinic acid a,c-diamide adenosyltransferase [Candidatus Micrarchaeota archaeon]
MANDETPVKVYTRKGDGGSTALYGGMKVRKDEARIEAVGTIDELNSVIGLALVHTKTPESVFLTTVQEDLFDIGAVIGTTPGMPQPVDMEFLEWQTKEIESKIDAMAKQLQPLKTFILPGGSDASAHLHHARTVCRRAERCLVSLNEEEKVPQNIIGYVNRLSSYLFVLARFENLHAGRPDLKWEARRKSDKTDTTLANFEKK